MRLSGRMRIAVLTLALVGCLQQLENAPTGTTPSVLVGPPVGVPGEQMEYEVALRGITLGRVQVAVGQPGWIAGKRAIVIKSRATSTGLVSMFRDVRWELTTTLDLTTGLPIHEIDESWVEIEGRPDHVRYEQAWTGSRYNLHAAAGALRGWQSQEGERARCEVRMDQLVIDVELWDAAREVLPGPRPAVRYEGIARGKFSFEVWISDDDARVPLRLRTDTRWGAVSFELVDYDAPRG